MIAVAFVKREKEKIISGNIKMLNLSFFSKQKLEAHEFQQDWNRGVYIPPYPEFLISFTESSADQNFPRRKQTRLWLMFSEQHGAQPTREF